MGIVLQGSAAGKVKGFDDKVVNERFAASRTASQAISLASTICIMPAVERMLLVLVAFALVAYSSLPCYFYTLPISHILH